MVGARPQFIKASSVSRALADFGDAQEIFVHTGQHFDEQMSDVFFRQLGLRKPDYTLGVHGGSHGEMTGRMLEALDAVIRREEPDAVIVYGDTNSTLAGALSAVKLHVPVVHVEAGLRSFNRRMPEEINRVLTDHASTLLCCPTRTAIEQLRREGFSKIINEGDLAPGTTNEFRSFGKTAGSEQWVANVGDVMLDVLQHFREAAKTQSRILEELNLTCGQYAVLTIHRAENTAEVKALEDLLEPLRTFACEMPVVFPIHPRTRSLLATANRLEDLAAASGIILTEPMSYLDFIQLQVNAAVVLTDSGGVQKEAFFLEVPCLTLRDETEWMETVNAGWNRLVGRRPRELVADYRKQRRMERSRPDVFGRGDAGERIVILVNALVSQAPRELLQ